MKTLIVSLFLILPFVGKAQHTFSIVAVDSVTNEIGSAGATCLSSEDGAQAISDIVLGTGAIHTQAWWTPLNQAAARVRMVAGDSPSEIMIWLQANDNGSQGGNITNRQYGAVDLNGGNPRTAAFTGNNNFDQKGHRLGSNYSIQGNILISQAVLDDMENAFLTTTGPLCVKLMAVMQAAKRPGADSRCLADTISSESAFIRIAQPTDTNSSYGNLWLDLNVWLDAGTFTGDPIDELQLKFNEWDSTNNCSDPPDTTSAFDSKNEVLIMIFPNPTNGTLKLETHGLEVDKIRIMNLLGELVIEEKITDQHPIELNMNGLRSGMYLISFYVNEKKITTRKIALHNNL